MEWQDDIKLAGPARVLLTGSETGGAFALARLTLAPFSPGAPAHHHLAHAEGCYVLSGTLAITSGDDTIMLRAGGALAVQPGVVHACWNPTASDATVLLIYTPGAEADEVLALAHASAPQDSL
jgi:quercetin dioxygenase-like cupin family protein